MDSYAGLARGLQPALFWFLGATIAVVVMLVIVRLVVGNLVHDSKDARGILGVVNRVALGVWLLASLSFAVYASSYTFSARVPRSDVNGQAIYDRMDRIMEERR